jgi:hypothetical protein
MTRKRVLKVGVAVVLALCAFLVGGYFIVDSVIKKKIAHQFASLSPATTVKYSKIETDLFSSSVSFNNLEIDFAPYTNLQLNRHTIKFSRAALKGISFYQFLFHKKLWATNLILEDGTLDLDQLLLDKKDSLQADVIREIRWPFKKLNIKNVELRKTVAYLHSAQRNEMLGRGDVSFTGLMIDTPGNRPAFSDFDVRVSNINYPLPKNRIVIGQAVVNSRTKTVSIDSLEILPSSQNSVRATIPSIRISGIKMQALLQEGVMAAQKIVLAGGSIFVHNSSFENDGVPIKLKKIHADLFKLDHSFIQYGDKKSICQFNGKIDLHDITVVAPFDKNHVHFGAVRATLSALRYSPDKYQTTEVKEIQIDSKKERIIAQNINIVPRIGKYAFGRKLGHQADWVSANISAVEITKPDIEKLLHQKIVAERISIGKSKVYVFRDRRLPRQLRIVPLPFESLQDVPFDIRAKSVTLASSTVEYEEFPKSGFGQTGILKIVNARLTLSPLINHPVPSDPAYIVMNATASIMGSGSAHATILTPMKKNKPYYIKGSIDKLQLTTLNSSSENLGKIRIKSGYLDFLSFDFTMTTQRSTGKIIGAYHRLIIQQLKKHTDEKNVADFASFMLRHVIIPLNKDRSLPERKRTGLVNYTRDPTRFVSYYFLQSLLMGVKKSFTLGFLLPK